MACQNSTFSCSNFEMRQLINTRVYSLQISPIGRLCECVLGCFSCVWLFGTLRTVACQALLSRKFSRQEYQSGLPCTPPRIFPTWGSHLNQLMPSALAGGVFTTSTIWLAKIVLFCFTLFSCNEWMVNRILNYICTLNLRNMTEAFYKIFTI